MKELVEYIVKSLVDFPDEVRVSEVPGRSTTVLEVQVADSDVGRVIGKSGRVVNAIRTITKVGAARRGKKQYSVEIV